MADLKAWIAARLRRSIPVLPSVDAYHRWAAAYPPAAHNALMQAEETAVIALLPDLTGTTILDLACGTGRYSRLARERGAGRVLATDNSPAMLHAGVAVGALDRPALAGLTALPFAAGMVDGVICGLALGHLPTIGGALAEIGRVLRPGGWALISDVHPDLFRAGGAQHPVQRTFTAAGRTYAVEHYVHSAAAYAMAGQAAGLRVVNQRDAALPDGVPVALVLKFVKD